MKKALLVICCLFSIGVMTALAQRGMRVRKNVPLDSIRLSDPAILADQKTKMYYMTGTGGMMWRSADLKLWEGPMRVTEFEADSWLWSFDALSALRWSMDDVCSPSFQG